MSRRVVLLELGLCAVSPLLGGLAGLGLFLAHRRHACIVDVAIQRAAWQATVAALPFTPETPGSTE